MNKDRIDLTIPNKPDYISLARLTTSGIGSSMALDIDDIEDIKVSIGEACINSLINSGDDINISFEIDEEKISICVSNVVEEISDELDEKKERELGLLIIKSLMDDVTFTKEGIKMIKYIEGGA